MRDNEIDKFAAMASETAMRAAADWFRLHPEAQYDIDALVTSLRSHVHRRFDQALDDAREAFEAQMYDCMTATFLADMRLAGIDAAKECAI